MERKLLRLAFPALMALFLLTMSRAYAQLPTLLSFPDTPCDSTSCGALYFANDADQPSAIVSVLLRDGVSFAITPATTLPDTILPHQSRSMTICFTPNRRGVITDSLYVVIRTAAGFDTAKVRVTGLSIGPDVAVSPSVLNFPKTNPGGSSTLKMALINNGERPFQLDATALTITPPFRLVTQLPATIDPGDTLVIEIAFEPQQRGVYSQQTDLLGGCSRKIQLGLNGVTDLIGGHAEVSFQNLGAVTSHIKAGKLKLLAVTSDARIPAFPNTPTMAEAGVPGVEVYSWQAVAAPAGLPKEVKAKLESGLTGPIKLEVK